jgi:hypothetical protein
MLGYAQLMKKTGGMTKKGKKESPAQNLVRELTTDHGVQSPGASQGPEVETADVMAASLEVQAAKKRKLILRGGKKPPTAAPPVLEANESVPHSEISISDDEEAETVGEALPKKRLVLSIFIPCMKLSVQNFTGF